MSVDYTVLSTEKWRRMPQLWKKKGIQTLYLMCKCQ